jgi:superfamily II DNA/RNA helicase
MKENGGFERLFRMSSFINHIICIIFDEAHCISEWSSFRADYKSVGQLRRILPPGKPIMFTSATLPRETLNAIKLIFGFDESHYIVFRQSTDRPNISLIVRKILCALNSFADLAFVLCGWKPGDSPPPKFLIFFDDINESVKASNYLRGCLPQEYRDKIKWYNSTMSDQFKETEVKRLLNGETWGLCATDSFGMVSTFYFCMCTHIRTYKSKKGMDIPDIKLVVQWKATCTLSMLWQRFGRAGRDKKTQATAIFLVEKEHFDDERKKREERKRKRQVGKTSPRKKTTADPGTSSKGPEADPELSDDESDSCLDVLQAMMKVDASKKRPDGPCLGKRKHELEPAVDCFINAKFRKLSCRRQPLNVHFENVHTGKSVIFLFLDTASGILTYLCAGTSSHLCNRSQPQGCERCGNTLPNNNLCCDIHSPSLSNSFFIPPQKVGQAPRRSRISKDEMTIPDDIPLLEGLENWREHKTEEEYGWAALEDIGPTLAMSNDVLNRIIACARHFKIQSVEDLKKETKWIKAEKWGNEVVALILQKRPPPPPSLPPLTTNAPLVQIQNNAMGTLLPSETTPKQRAPVRCGRCRATGHNGM